MRHAPRPHLLLSARGTVVHPVTQVKNLRGGLASVILCSLPARYWSANSHVGGLRRADAPSERLASSPSFTRDSVLPPVPTSATCTPRKRCRLPGRDRAGSRRGPRSRRTVPPSVPGHGRKRESVRDASSAPPSPTSNPSPTLEEFAFAYASHGHSLNTSCGPDHPPDRPEYLWYKWADEEIDAWPLSALSAIQPFALRFFSSWKSTAHSWRITRRCFTKLNVMRSGHHLRTVRPTKTRTHRRPRFGFGPSVCARN